MLIQTINISSKAGFQEIKLPKELNIDDDKAYIKKIGNALFIIPFHDPWGSMMESINKFTNDFMDERNQAGNRQNRELFD